MSSVTLIRTPFRLSSRVAAPKARRTLVVKAYAQADRRQVLGGLVAGVTLFPAALVQAVEAERLGGQQQQQQQQDIGARRGGQERQRESRISFDDARNRVTDSRRALGDVMEQYIKRANWNESQNQLQRQRDNLRNDLDNLAMNASNSNVAQQKTRDFFAQVDRLDQAIRDRNKDRALDAYDRMIDSLDNVMGEVGVA